MRFCTIICPRIKRLLMILVLVIAGGMLMPGSLIAAPTRIITIDSKKFTVEIAADNPTRQRGLMGRTLLPANHGMLFLFPRPMTVDMWMKDTPLSLDMIFVNSRHQISHIVTGVKANSTAIISSQGEVIAVIELAAGTVKAKGIKIGDRVEY